MARKSIRHIRQHARRHEEAHLKLKDLLSRTLHIEKVWDLFLITFLLTLSSIIIFFSWGKITDFFTDLLKENDPSEISQEEILDRIHGFESGILASYQINGQTADQYIRYIHQIPGSGYQKGLMTTTSIGNIQKEQGEITEDRLLASVSLSTELSKGYHLTSIRQAGSLQKSVLSTYYLGEKTVNIDSTLQTDAQLLSKISNALSVDVFAYLNQSQSRANSLESFLNLLETLQIKATERSQELTSVISFLNANFQSQDLAIEHTEEAFFSHLEIFDGENAEEELANFIGLQKEQSEVRAKIGAYEGLKGYYDFFLPKLDNLIRAIKANRDPLIAGVKVVEIQNMTLPLIIREQ